MESSARRIDSLGHVFLVVFFESLSKLGAIIIRVVLTELLVFRIAHLQSLSEEWDFVQILFRPLTRKFGVVLHEGICSVLEHFDSDHITVLAE